MNWLWTLMGMIIGGAFFETGGMVAGGVAGYLLSTVRQLSLRVAQLSDEVARLRPSLAPVSAESTEFVESAPDIPEAAEAMPVVGHAPATRAVSPVLEIPAPRVDEEWPTAKPVTAHEYGWQPPADAVHSPPFWQRAYDWLITGNVVAKLGVIVLFFGLAFLLKYAADRAVFPIEWRLAAVGWGGLVLLGFGWFLRHRHAGYALVLQGGGVGVVYLTLFAAFRLYGVLPASVTMGLMLVVVGLAAWLAMTQDSRSLAMLGISGGFLAPILAGRADGSHIDLFSYYLMLNLGIVIIAWRKAWRGLNLLAFLFTFVIGTAWGVLSYQPELFASTEPFLIGFFLIFLATALLFARRQIESHQRDYVQSSLVFGPPLVGFSWQAGMVAPFEYGLAWSALGLGVVYLLLFAVLRRGGDARYALLRDAFFVLGIGFVSLAVPFAFDAQWTTMTWAVEGLAMLWIGLRQGRRFPVGFGLFLQCAAGVSFLDAAALSDSHRYLLDAYFLAGGLIGLSGLASAYLLRQTSLGVWFWAWGLLWWFSTGFYDLLESPARSSGTDAFPLWLMFTAVTFGGLAALRRWVDWSLLSSVPALLTVGIGGVGGLILAFSHSLLADWGWLGWLMGFAVLYGSLFLFERWQVPILAAKRVHGVGFWFLVVVLAATLAQAVLDALLINNSFSLAWLASHTPQSAWRSLSWGLVPALSLWSIGRSHRWPLTVAWSATYRGWVAAGLMVFLLCWLSLVQGVWLPDPQYGISWAEPLSIGYLPLLNGVDGVSMLMLGSLWFYLRTQGQQLAPAFRRLSTWWLGLAAFVWMNAVIARSVSVWADIPLDDWHFLQAAKVQAAYSIAWSLLGLALIFWASRRQQRAGWWVAAGLLLLVVLKLFLVDLSGSETLARIISFVGAGILLLLAGYVAPIPPKPHHPVAASG